MRDFASWSLVPTKLPGHVIRRADLRLKPETAQDPPNPGPQASGQSLPRILFVPVHTVTGAAHTVGGREGVLSAQGLNKAPDVLTGKMEGPLPLPECKYGEEQSRI